MVVVWATFGATFLGGMIFKSINILGLTLAFVGALMLARPWRAVIYHFQNRQEAKNWDRALAVVALNNKPAAMALDKMHQLDRLSIGLPNRRVLNAEGLRASNKTFC